MTPRPAPAAYADREARILILAPVGRDARLAEDALARAGLGGQVCPDLADLTREIALGAGAVLLTDEALVPEHAADPDAWVGTEPPWSQLPLVVLTGNGRSPQHLGPLRRLERRRNVTFLERPVSRLTLVSTIRAALESRRRQYAVRDLLQELQAAVRQRDEFLATLGHELRNPLGAIRSAVDLLKAARGDTETVVRHAGGVLDRQTQHLNRLLDDLLEISRITRGKLALRRAPLELGRLCRYAVEAARSQIERRHHDLALHLAEHPVWANADGTRIEQILWNLFSNAGKYTEPGGHLALTLAVDGDQAEIRVHDDGRGMTPEFLARAFELFAQAEVGRGGLGLGLALSRQLAEMHGGSLTATSGGLGRGSEFVLRLPCCTPPADAPRPPEPAALPARRRVLVVEDHTDLAWGLVALLEDLGHEARSAGTGHDAIAMAGDYRPDLVLVDIGLPDLDGAEVAARLRAALGPRTVLAAMTGFGEEAVRRRSLEAGCNRHLTKPVSLADLNQLLAGLED